MKVFAYKFDKSAVFVRAVPGMSTTGGRNGDHLKIGGWGVVDEMKLCCLGVFLKMLFCCMGVYIKF